MKLSITIIISILIILLVTGLVFLLTPKKSEAPAEKTNPELKEISDKIYGFTAEIEKIEGKTLHLNGWVPKNTEPPSSARIIVKAVVTDETEIAKIKFPERTEKSQNQETIPPEKTSMSFDELEVGDEIHILTQENISDNIKNNQSFNLKSIFITD